MVRSAKLEAFASIPILALDFETGSIEQEGKGNLVLFGVAGYQGTKLISGSYTEEQFDSFWRANKKKKFIFHNAKFDLAVIKRKGFSVEKVDFEDTMIMAHLIDENRRKSLKDLRVSELNLPERDKWEQVDKEDLAAYKIYNRYDAEDTILLYRKFLPEIASEKLDVVYELEKQVIFPIMDMEIGGIKIDTELLLFQQDALEKLIAETYELITVKVGYELNLNSTMQLAELFYNILRYPPLPTWQNKTGFSTRSEVLEYISQDKKYPDAAEIAGHMLKHRMYVKLHSGFVKSILAKLDSRGYVYPSFNATGTVTGRFSANTPNMQQVPTEPFVEGDLKTHIRSLFIVEEDEYFLTADYSQIELRFMAEFSGDKTMSDAFINDLDIHQITADRLGLPRDAAKALNFGIGYGMGAPRFAHLTGISIEKASKFIQRFWREYSGLAKFFKDIILQARQCGYVRTISGRKRRLYLDQTGMDRMSVNSVIQGSAADLIKAAMVYAYKLLDHKKARFLISVHDEISLAIKRDYIWDAHQILKYAMENAVKTRIPLKVDPKVGLRWSETK